ncbi:MAG: bifunctional UDP-N-acetylglucosamine diphosphorylase/glucosamine-1-phosphate N-acetyltransferase GlmU [Actinobacteria bacterium]|nr:bifunctional UDP-N-acetylglucosamine diphosphorylase/glucosamine-1-phosphate N-acetyltransferase GlmU [Actinomycetota bacterium]
MNEEKPRKGKLNNKLAVVVMAAGKGKRMKSGLPKVMHRVCGKPMIELVLGEVRSLKAGKVVLVVGNGAELVKESAGPGVKCVEQAEQKGTGHAVLVAMEELGNEFDEVMVLPGDSPLIRRETLEGLAVSRRRDSAAAAVFTCEMDDPTGYGRIVRGGAGTVTRIVEESDASPEERTIHEINASTYVFDRKVLGDTINGLSAENEQGEYYLTDVIENIVSGGGRVVAVRGDPEESLGVNNRIQLSNVNEIMRERVNNALMMNGVTILDPRTTYIDQGVEIGRDTVVFPMTFISEGSTIGEKCSIGPSTKICNSVIGNECTIEYSWLDGCDVADEVLVGPYAKLRPGCRLGAGSKAGTFVEMKEARIGGGTKVPHLSYIGDADVGRDANIGAGTITCNYDGERKSRTLIGNRAFLGSDTMLVAPVKIGDDAVTAAGSSITRDVPEGSLGIERAEQKNVPGWRKRKKKKRVGPETRNNTD